MFFVFVRGQQCCCFILYPMICVKCDFFLYISFLVNPSFSWKYTLKQNYNFHFTHIKSSLKSLILIFSEFFVKQSRILDKTHYSKTQIFVQKFNFDKTPNIFTSFSPKFFFWQFFSWNQSCQQLKSPKP